VTLPLRSRLTLFCAGAFALLLAVLSIASYRVLARQLDLDETARLTELTTGLHGYLRFESGAPAIVFDDSDADQAAFVHDAARYYQVYDASDGRLLAQSDGVEPLGLHFTSGEVQAFLDKPRTFDIQTAYGRFRFTNSPIYPASGKAYLLQVGIPLQPMDNTLNRYVGLLLWLVLPGLLMALVAVWWIARVALSPLSRLAADASSIGIGTLNRRLAIRGTGDQLDEVASAFNETLARLENAVAEMRQFSSALAHELRTPLAALRGEIETALLGSSSEIEYRENLTSQIEEIDKLTRLISQLLTLARAESGEIRLEHHTVDLAALATAVTEQLELVAEDHDLDLRCVVSQPVAVTGDRGWLERLLLNLLDNAMKFTRKGGSVRVSVSREGDSARVDVRDTGIGMPPHAIPHVFERFYRVDPARSPAADGAGLGLSLVKWIIDRHQGRIAVDSHLGTGSTFTVWLPVASSEIAERAEDAETRPAQGSRSRDVL
jgi:heavy metal sensor kinase